MGLFRPNIDRIDGYLPGEQPQDGGWIKLNTNENPYPPSPRVVEAIVEAARGRLNTYPDPLATKFRQAAAPVFGVTPEWILPANGSDENLTILLRSFVDSNDLVAYPYPSYILYETLADIQGGRHERLLLNPDWSWNMPATRPVIDRSKLVFIPNPNSPSGNRWSDDEILSLVPPNGILVLDEAYGDFADQPHRGELLRRPGGERIIITRTFSKSFSLAGIRLGFAIARPELIAGMQKVKDSYNCDTLSLAAGLAAITDLPAMEENTNKIRATRTRLERGLTELGFAVVPSQANFVWCTHPTGQHREIYEALKSRKILVRFMRFPQVAYAPDQLLSGLRISIGTDVEIDSLLNQLKTIV
ncbi:MAG: histidinol-phosphate transaminase [Planctomycetota bacterium]|nr:histidinol-phosphate transaminase [Planctomycetota bacterium]